MTRPSLTASRQRQTLLERFCISPTACHATGAGLALSLIALIALVWAGGQRTVQTVTLNQQVVSLEELTEVVGSAEQWRDEFTAEYQASEALALRMREIGRWLPGTADWMDVEERIQAAADPLQLRIVSIRPGGEFVGTRVGVLAVNCRVEGTFEQLCRFLAALPQLEHPIVCSAADVRRVGGDREVPADIECAATLALRVPFAAEGTVAAGLIRDGENDAG